MGTIRHNAIIITAGFKEIVEIAHKKAVEVFEGKVTNWVEGVTTNRYYSFMVVPDGIKEELDTSDEWDNKRDNYIGWLKSYIIQEDNPYKGDEILDFLDYVEVAFGGDTAGGSIVRSSDD